MDLVFGAIWFFKFSHVFRNDIYVWIILNDNFILLSNICLGCYNIYMILGGVLKEISYRDYTNYASIKFK